MWHNGKVGASCPEDQGSNPINHHAPLFFLFKPDNLTEKITPSTP